MVTKSERYRFNVEDYERMAEVGILDPDARLELIEGEIVRMTPSGPRHANVASLLASELRVLEPDRAIVWVQSSVRLSDEDLVDPDLALIRPDFNRRRTQRPTAADILLVVEVADSSIRKDRQRKASLYARAGIPEYWIVDLKSRPATISVYRGPTGQRYESLQLVHAGNPLSPLAFPDLAIDTERLLEVEP